MELTWSSFEGADYYEIRSNGKHEADAADTSYKVIITPCKTIELYAVSREGEVMTAALSFEPVKSPSVKLWTIRDPNPEHPSWLIFDSSGNAVALSYPERTKGVWYMDDSDYGAWFVTNWTRFGGYNRDIDAGFQIAYDDVDSIDMAPEPGDCYPYFPHNDELKDDLVGIFWLDAGPDSLIGEGDHFGKFLVLDYNANDNGSSSAITDIYYQAEPMLIWLVTR